MSVPTPTELRLAAAALASVPVSERRSLLEAAGRSRSARCCPGAELAEFVDARAATRAAAIAKTLADPVRAQLVAVLRGHGGEVCQCDLNPLFDLAQPTLSHHLAKLVAAGLVSVERRGRWAYYSIAPARLDELRSWLSPAPAPS